MIRYVLSPLLTKPLPVYQHATVLRETLVLTSCIQPFVPGTFVIPEPPAAEQSDDANATGSDTNAGVQASNLHAARARTQLAQALENIECVLAAANVGASLATAVQVSVFLDHHDRDRDAAAAALDELLKSKREKLSSATVDGGNLAFVPPHCEFVGVRVIPRGCNVGVAVVALSADAYRCLVAEHGAHGQSASKLPIKVAEALNSRLWFPEPRAADEELSALSHLATASSGSPSVTAHATVPASSINDFQPSVRALGAGVIEVRCVLPICIADVSAVAIADGQTARRRRVASELTAAQQAALCLDELERLLRDSHAADLTCVLYAAFAFTAMADDFLAVNAEINRRWPTQACSPARTSFGALENSVPHGARVAIDCIVATGLVPVDAGGNAAAQGSASTASARL